MERDLVQRPLKSDKPDESYGLVLGGGGSKGCYHVGALQAMSEEKIAFDAISGTSIGALVGIFYTTGSLDLLTDFVFSMQPGNIASDLPILPMTLKEKVKGTKTILNFIIRYFDSKMDITPLRAHFRMMFDYDAFKNSPVKYACMSFNDTKKEPRAFFKGEITADNAEDIVMASAACYPAFPKVMIDGEEYVDGMYADNVPIELLETIHPDASRIVVIDLHDPGEMVPPALTREMFYIQPLLQPGNPLDFSTEHAEALYSQGYLETKKYLGKYAGYLYTFPLDDQPLIDVVEEYIGAQITQMKVVLPDIKDLSDHLYRQALGYVPPELPNSQQEHYYFGRMVEALALMAKINPIALRDYRQFLEEIKDRLDHLSVMDRNPEEFLLVNLLSNVSREEVPIQMYRLLKNNNGHFPERIESLKDRFPTSYTMAVIRYCLDLLLEALNPQPEKEPEEAQSAKQAASDNETAGQETEESEASDQENTDMAGEENANSSPAKPENAQSAVSDKADSSNKPNLDSGCLMTCEAQTRKSAETEAKSEPKLPPLPEQEEDEVPIGAVCIVEEAQKLGLTPDSTKTESKS